MVFKVFKNSEQASKEVSKILIDAIKKNKNIKLGLATGSTPIELYKNLVEDYLLNNTDYSDVVTFNLDEYLFLPENHEQSYRTFMNENLFKKININLKNTYFPKENINYDELIDSFGGIDIQILGIGTNGHIGFNEPGSMINSLTREVELSNETINVNASKFFNGNIDDVPKKALSMGLKSITKAKKIILLAFGETKANAISKLKKIKYFDENFPASSLISHPNVLVILDEKANLK